MSKETHRSGLYYVIPSSIMDSEALEPLAKLLYALLSGLADGEGKCFPSDDYLSKRLHCSLRQTKDLLTQLTKNGLIERETHPCSANPFRKVRTITVRTEFKKSLRSAQACPLDEAHPCPLEGHTRALIESEANIESEETKKAVCFGKFVKLFQKEYEELEKLAGSAEALKQTIEEINDYLSSTGKPPYKDYAATIRNWLRRKKNNPQPQNSGASPSPRSSYGRALPSQEVENREWVGRLSLKHSANKDIFVGPNYIEFKSGPMRSEVIRFDEHGFRDRCLSWLRKMKLSAEGL